MSGLKIALLSIFTPLLLGGAGVTAKLYGDAFVWVPIGTYQQEKLYDLEDEAEYLNDKEELGGLTELEKRELKRLLKQIDRLEDTITK